MSTPAPSVSYPDAAQLAALGIGSVALQSLSPVTAPAVTPDHPRVVAAATSVAAINAAVVAGSVVDPEIPVLTVADLGVLRRVAVGLDGVVDVEITPTYSGCPAVAAMSTDIRQQVLRAGYAECRVHTVLSPAWTTDDMTPAAREALQRFGIAPPGPRPSGPVALTLGRRSVSCPVCNSANTRQSTPFGSTSCKSMWVCQDCREPFDHFKELR